METPRHEAKDLSGAEASVTPTPQERKRGRRRIQDLVLLAGWTFSYALLVWVFKQVSRFERR